MELNPNSLQGDQLLTNPNGVPLNIPRDAANGFSDVEMPTAMPEDMFKTFPDLHIGKTELSKTDKQNISQVVNNVINKETLVEEAVKRELENIKYKSAPDSPRDILKDLIMRGELTKVYKIYGHYWKLRALDQGDILLAVDDIKDSTETTAGRMVSIAFSKVVYSIEKINNIPIYEFFPAILPTDPKFGGEKLNYVIAIKKALRAYLLAMPQRIVDEVYEKYVELEAERDKALDDLKN